ncbi:MAG TPA: PIN domain-containing protein [Chloroflexota bacterium]|nr:PIN domain-containing protein [Chloroflexota bacterium]
MPDGLIDTNVFIHAQTYDAHSEECLRFLEAIREGRVQARLEPLLIHELSYALPHYRKGMNRAETADYLLTVLSWEGFTGEKDKLVDAVRRWRDAPGLTFVDAYLATLALGDGCPVFTKNASELSRQGVVVPIPLPNQ